MKITHKTESELRPPAPRAPAGEITITFDNVDQMKAFHFVFNHSGITDVLEWYGVNTGALRAHLQESNPGCYSVSIHDELCIPFHKAMKRWCND